MSLNIKTKFMITNIAIILPMFILIIYFSVFYVDYYNISSAKEALLNNSYIIQLNLYQYLSENTAKQLLEKDLFFLNYELSKMVNMRSQILYLEDNISVDSSIENNDIFTDFINDSEIELAVNNKKNYILKRVNGRRFLLMTFPFYSSSQLDSSREIMGVGRLIYSLEKMDNQKSNLIKILSIIGLFVLTTIIILYLYFTGQIVKPLYKLKSVVQLFASGNLHSKIKIDSGDEIEDLANSFNKMAEEISVLIENLKTEKNKQKDFYNSMTHEIRTPLTTILGYADIIKRVDSKESRDDCLRYIDSEGKRLLRMINELLTSSKLDLYDFEINKEKCNLSKLIYETIGIIKYKANKYGIKINDNIEENIFLEVDKDKIKETILNLMDNAIKYSGTEKIELTLLSSNGEEIIQIRDYGKGISNIQLEKIRSSFSGIQVDKISNHDGHGFGLPISAKIVELHGGDFNIQSIVGKGTTLYIRLYR